MKKIHRFLWILGMFFGIVSESMPQDILIFSDKPHYDNQRYTKFQGICFENEIKVDHIASNDFYRSPYINILNEPEGVIYDCWLISDHNISELYKFIRNGGNVVMFYSAEWSKRNQMLQELLSVSINAENVILNKNSGGYRFPPESLPPWLGNFKVGIITTYECCTLPAYLSTGVAGNKYYITSMKSSKSRAIIFEYSIGDGKVIFIQTIFGVSSYTPDFRPIDNTYNRFPESFMCDQQIDNYENESAAKRLTKWLINDQ